MACRGLGRFFQWFPRGRSVEHDFNVASIEVGTHAGAKNPIRNLKCSRWPVADESTVSNVFDTTAQSRNQQVTLPHLGVGRALPRRIEVIQILEVNVERSNRARLEDRPLCLHTSGGSGIAAANLDADIIETHVLRNTRADKRAVVCSVENGVTRHTEVTFSRSEPFGSMIDTFKQCPGHLHDAVLLGDWRKSDVEGQHLRKVDRRMGASFAKGQNVIALGHQREHQESGIQRV